MASTSTNPPMCVGSPVKPSAIGRASTWTAIPTTPSEERGFTETSKSVPAVAPPGGSGEPSLFEACIAKVDGGGAPNSPRLPGNTHASPPVDAPGAPNARSSYRSPSKSPTATAWSVAPVPSKVQSMLIDATSSLPSASQSEPPPSNALPEIGSAWPSPLTSPAATQVPIWS